MSTPHNLKLFYGLIAEAKNLSRVKTRMAMYVEDNNILFIIISSLYYQPNKPL